MYELGRRVVADAVFRADPDGQLEYAQLAYCDDCVVGEETLATL